MDSFQKSLIKYGVNPSGKLHRYSKISNCINCEGKFNYDLCTIKVLYAKAFFHLPVLGYTKRDKYLNRIALGAFPIASVLIKEQFRLWLGH